MAHYCQLVMIRLDDMQDLAKLIDGEFTKKNTEFNLETTIENLKRILEFKASLRNVKLYFESYFKDEDNQVRKSMLEIMQSNLK